MYRYFRSVLKQRFTFYPHDCFFAHQHYWVSFHHDFQPRVFCHQQRVFCHHQRVFYRTKWFFSWTTVVVFLIWIYLTHVFDSRSLFSFFYWMDWPVSLWCFFPWFFLDRLFSFCFGYFCIFDSTWPRDRADRDDGKQKYKNIHHSQGVPSGWR